MDGRDRVVAAAKTLLDEWTGPLHDPTPPKDWENITVPQFLEAMAAWLEDSRPDGKDASDGWPVFAEALRAAAMYE